MNTLMLLAFIAGGAIAIQANLNAHLGVLLKNSLLGTTVAFFIAGLFSLLMVVLTTKQYPQFVELKRIPLYFWFIGGAFSAFGVALFYYLIPKMGVGAMMSYALTGQMLIAAISSHYGWFNLPINALTQQKLIGLIALIIGVILMNREFSYGA